MDPEARAEVLEAPTAAWQAEKRKPENRAEVRRAELITAFRSATWLGAYDQAHAEARVPYRDQSFRTARIALGGIELVHMLRKGQLASAAGDAPMSAAEAFYSLVA